MLNKTKYRTCTPSEGEEITLEREAQINSIVGMMAESLEKLKISLILPHIFENLFCVRQRLGDSEYKHCINLIEQYIKERKSDIELESDPHLNYRLTKIIDYFYENTQILKYFSDWVDDISESDKIFIQAFEQLRVVSEHRLRISALSVLNREKRIHEVHHANELLKKNIGVLERLLKHRRVSMKWKLAANEIMIEKLKNDLDGLKYEHSILVRKEIFNSRRSNKQVCVNAMIKKRDLDEELESMKTKYENLLKSDLKQQKIARDEKNKLLLQLQAVLKKFDDTMIEKVKENLYLKDEFENQKKEFEAFMIEYKKEEKVYDRIVRSKREEEKRQHEEKVLLFTTNRAARIIQKWWRKLKGRKKKHKKGKKT